MNKKPLWQRVNRGFVVTMALLVVTALYVLVTQLMLIPERQKLQALTDSYCARMENASMLTDEQLAAFKNTDALTAEQARLKNELTDSFTENSPYLDDALNNLVSSISMQLDNQQRLRTRSERSPSNVKCIIDQDIATYSVLYCYTASGDFMNYKTNKLESQTDVQMQVQVNCTFKKTNGEWKFYRVSSSSWNGGMY